MGKVRFPFVTSDVDSTCLFQTYSCDVEGCDKVFSRDYNLRKHKVTHEDPSRCEYFW